MWLVVSHAGSVVLGGLIVAVVLRFRAWALSRRLRKLDRLEREMTAKVASAEKVRRDAERNLADSQKLREELEGATKLMKFHLPRMHEMAMQLNMVDDVCSCADCQAYRESKGLQ